MNSEELELSLRTEFENYLKSALAEVKQEVSDFQDQIAARFDEQKKSLQEKIERDLDEQKSDFSRLFQEFSEKFDKDSEIEDSFKESVAEHLKLARDEGARITATAIAEAEKMEEDSSSAAAAAASANFTDLRDAINEISGKDSQSEILKSLVNHAAQYTPRGAFFIVKNEHLVGWRVFGTEEQENPHAVREVFFPISSETTLSASVKNLETVETGYGNYPDDSIYLNQLDFDQPEKMFAIPLVARGRGVAVLYADAGTNGEKVNVEALETLVRVAGLTVEVLASSKNAARPAAESSQASEQSYRYESAPEPHSQAEENEPQKIEQSENYSYPADSFESGASEDFSGSQTPQAEEEDQIGYRQSYETAADSEQTEETADSYSFDDPYGGTEEDDDRTETSTGFDFQTAEEGNSGSAYEESAPETESSYGNFEWNSSPEAPEYSGSEADTEDYQVDSESYGIGENDAYDSEMPVQFDDAAPNADTGFEFDRNSSSSETMAAAPSDYQPEPSAANDAPVSNDFDYSVNEENVPAESADSFESSAPESAVSQTAPEASPQPEAASTAPVRPRFGDRNVDLPIEVTEDERRLHNDARRFARLLVSEIKLYNEQKVKEGRESSDLYERLREAIDRSREMYDKRVQPPVAAKFDYFHYELVNTLAEGEENKLGGSYPGTTV